MNTTLAHRTITNWTNRHPQTMAFFDRLNQRGIAWGIYCGSAAQLLTGDRASSDIDIVIDDRDFSTVALLAPHFATVHDDREAKVDCGDGIVLDFPRRSICFWMDGQEVEIMASTTAKRGYHKYHLGMSKLTVSHRLMFEVGSSQLYISHPFDTMALKSVLQRGRDIGKHDAEDIASLARRYPADYDYAVKRAAEIRLTNREFDFLAMCNVSLNPIQTMPKYGILYAY